MKKFILIIACLLSVSSLFAKTTKVKETKDSITYKVTDTTNTQEATVVSLKTSDPLTVISCCVIQFGNYCDHFENYTNPNFKAFERLAIENGNAIVIREDCAVLFLYHGGYGCEVYGWKF